MPRSSEYRTAIAIGARIAYVGVYLSGVLVFLVVGVFGVLGALPGPFAGLAIFATLLLLMCWPWMVSRWFVAHWTEYKPSVVLLELAAFWVADAILAYWALK